MISFDKREEVTSVFGLNLKGNIMKKISLYCCQTFR